MTSTASVRPTWCSRTWSRSWAWPGRWRDEGRRPMSVKVKSWTELQKMATACRLVIDTLDALERAAQPGVTTKELDRIAYDKIVGAGARPAFLGYKVRGNVYP